MARRAATKRATEAHGTDDERIRKLTLTALECRVDSHNWPRGEGIEYVHLESHPDGSVKLGERRKTCHTCGLPRYEIYSFPYPGAPPQFVSGPHYHYREVEGYLIKHDPTRPRPTRDDFRSELWARTDPWGNATRVPAPRRQRAPQHN
jgi:hypothetical protein